MTKPKWGRCASLNSPERFATLSHNCYRLDFQESAPFEVETAYAQAFVTPFFDDCRASTRLRSGRTGSDATWPLYDRSHTRSEFPMLLLLCLQRC